MATSKEQQLAGLPLFSTCRPDELRRVAKLVDEVVVPPGTVLCTEGTSGREAFVVADGRVSVSTDGRPVAVLGPGELVGETALLTGGVRTATVTALVPTRLFVIEARRFSSLFGAAPEVGRKMAAILAGRLAQAQSGSLEAAG